MFLKSNSSCLMSNFPADILIIDDERQIRRLLNLTLTGAGYHVRECENGQLGLSETALKRPDAIILDLGLPDINGLEVLKQLREWTQVPILILTAWDREDEKVDACIGVIADHCRQRTEVVPNNVGYGIAVETAYPMEVTVGGATVFVTNVERFEKL